jgi:hypothetical protein
MRTALPKKLQIKPGDRIGIVDAPPGFTDRLQPLPAGASVTSRRRPVDVVLAFATDQAHLQKCAPRALRAVKPHGILWLCYPKKTSSLASDLQRESVWPALKEFDWLPVSQVAIDDTWSALRFKPRAEIAMLTRSF